MPLDLGAPVMLGWTPLWMNLSRENSVLMQCGPPPMATNGVGSGTKDSGCIWSETAEDGRPMSRGRPSPHYARTTCCDRGYGCPSGRPRVSNLATYRQVRLRSESLRSPGGTTISTISQRRLVHNGGSQDAGKLLDRGSPCAVMHGRPEPGRSVPQGCIVAPIRRPSLPRDRRKRS
jgi:hypothetical protein